MSIGRTPDFLSRGKSILATNTRMHVGLISIVFKNLTSSAAHVKETAIFYNGHESSLFTTESTTTRVKLNKMLGDDL